LNNLSNKCPDCGKWKGEKAHYCRSCGQKGVRNPMYGKRPKSWLGHITYCCMDCGAEISRPTAQKGQGRCRSCSRTGVLSWNHKTALTYKGKEHHNWKGGWRQNLPVCVDCGKKLAYNKSIRCQHCNAIFLYHTRQTVRTRLMTPKHIMAYKVGNTNMRSSWEVLVSRFLTLSNIKWKYEPKRFYFDNTSYTPDFYIPEFDCFIEIKGWMRDSNKKKLNRFKSLFPDIIVTIWTKKELMLYLGITKHQLSTYYKQLKCLTNYSKHAILGA
jgi:DNA-directed RNA polymerase subunit RPC12/RpoP